MNSLPITKGVRQHFSGRCLLKRVMVFFALISPFAATAFSADKSAFVDAGVGMVDITPTDEVTLAGSPSPKKTSMVKTRLFVRALVLSEGEKKAAIVTLD